MQQGAAGKDGCDRREKAPRDGTVPQLQARLAAVGRDVGIRRRGTARCHSSRRGSPP